MILKKKENKKKERLAIKRPNDFWAGFAFSSLIVSIILLVVLDMPIEVKSCMVALLVIVALFLYYLETTSKILRLSLKSLMFWRKDNDTIEKYSVAIEYETLVEMIESKKNLEEALKMIEGLETDQKISEFIKFINNNNNNKIWKN